jgi:hypothetical protein
MHIIIKFPESEMIGKSPKQPEKKDTLLQRMTENF